MSQSIDAIKKLVATWPHDIPMNAVGPHCLPNCRRCQLESLIPQVEDELAAHTEDFNAVSEMNARLTETISHLQAELAALKEVGPCPPLPIPCEVCGKPDADGDGVWIDTPTEENPTHETWVCGECISKRERLIEVAAYRKAADDLQRVLDECQAIEPDPNAPIVTQAHAAAMSLLRGCKENILRFISPDAMLALDAYVQSKLAEARKEWEAGR